MKQGTIAFLILLEAAVVLGLVYYGAGGYQAFIGRPAVAVSADMPETGTTAEAAGSVSENEAAVPEEPVIEEDPNVLPAGMEWGLKSREEYLCSEETGTLYLSMLYEYDTAGNLTGLYGYRPDGTETYKEEYQYDADGLLTRYVYTPSVSENSVRAAVYTYDEEKRLSRIDTYDETATVITTLGFLYDEEGRVYREVRYLPEAVQTEDGEEEVSAEDPKMVVYTVREYKFDKDGNVIKDWSFFADGKISGPWEEYEYDEEGRLSAILHRESDGTLLLRESYTYTDTTEEDGQVSSVISCDADGTVRWRHYKDYDEQGRLIHSEVRDEETLVTWQLYVYDEEGRKIRMNDNAGEVLYIYNEDGLIDSTSRYMNVGETASEDNLRGRTVYTYQPVPTGTARLPED